jgi:hypothetical protein
MPIEVLTREELEKLVEEKLKKLLSEMEISKKIADLEFSTSKLRDDIVRLSVRKVPVPEPEPIATALTRDLAQWGHLLEIRVTMGSVTLKPKGYLAAQEFRAVSEVVKKHGGFWSSERRMFIVHKHG